MSRSRTLFGAVVLCALSLCAFGVAGASAGGMTAVVCTEVGAGEGEYDSSHCNTPSEPGKYETVPVQGTTEIEIKGEGNSLFKVTLGAAKLEVKCTEMHSTAGDVKNIIEGELLAQGKGIVLHYTNCKASLQSDTTKTCEVQSISGVSGNNATIETNPLLTLTGPEHNVTFSPEAGEVLAEFKILAGACLAATVTVKVTGSVIGIADTNKHSHITFKPETNGGKLKANGAAASYEGTHLSWMKGEPEVTVGLQTFE